MVPPAPVVFSTNTGWPKARAIGPATSRAVTSVVPPAAKGTTTTTGRVGFQVGWAEATDAGRAAAVAAARSRSRRRMVRSSSPSEAAGQAEHVLGDVAEDQVGADRHHLVQPRLPELALDVVLVGEAVAAVELQAGVPRLPRGLGREVLRHV